MKTSILKASAVALAATFGLGSAQAAVIYYQQGFSNNLYKYDTVADVETLVGNLGLAADSTGMAFAPGGTLYAYDRGTAGLYSVNTATAATTLIGAAGIGAEDLTISLNGTTGYATFGDNLYSIDLGTGVQTSLGSIGLTLDGLTTAPIAVTVMGTNYAAGTVFGVDSGSIYVVDVVTPGLTLIGSSSGANETFDFGSDGTLYGHDSGGGLFTINLNDLSATLLKQTTPGLVFGMAVAPDSTPAVPEPATWLMMIAGFGIVGARLRKSTRKVSFA
jgi:hypothetical protein